MSCFLLPFFDFCSFLVASQTQRYFLAQRNAQKNSLCNFFLFIRYHNSPSIPIFQDLSPPHLSLHLQTFFHYPPLLPLLLSHVSTPTQTNSINLPFLHDSETTKLHLNLKQSTVLSSSTPHVISQRAILAWGSPRRQGPYNPHVYQSFTATKTPGNNFCCVQLSVQFTS